MYGNVHQFGGRKENFLWKSYCVNFKCNLDVFLNILMYSFWEVWLMVIQILCILGSLAVDSVLNLFCLCLSVLGVSPYSHRLVHRTGCSWLLNYNTLGAQWKHPANDYILLMFVVLFAFLYVRNINIVFWRVKISLILRKHLKSLTSAGQSKNWKSFKVSFSGCRINQPF